MHHRSACALLLAVGLLPAALQAQAPPKRPASRPSPATDARPQTLTIRDIVQRESPAIVAIHNLDARGEVQGTGTGFIVMSEGIIITNYHVIEGAHDALVKLKNGEVYDRVRVVDYDKRRDIAVLQIRATGLPMVTLGNSETIEVGDDAIAIGNPKGLEHTVSSGLISARRTDVPGLEGTRVFQTSAPISPGSSGGPLYNNRGEVIGITTAQYRGEGAQNLNFAVDFKYASLMFGQGPGMNITLADLTAKEKPAPPPQQQRAQSAPPPQQQAPSAPSSGAKAPDPTGNRYTDPTGYASIDLQPGWRPEAIKQGEQDRVMNLSNGKSQVWLTRRSDITDAQRLFDIYYDSFKKGFVEMTADSKLVETTLPGGPAKAQWFILKSNDGSKIKILLGVMILKRGGIVFTGITSEGNTEDRGPISSMFVTVE